MNSQSGAYVELGHAGILLFLQPASDWRSKEDLKKCHTTEAGQSLLRVNANAW